MEIRLTKRPKNPSIINGFPGFGMVGTIAAEFLVQHLKTEQIGKVILEEMPALIAIHEGRIIEPLSIYYNKEFNLVIVHSISGIAGSEWKMSDVIIQLTKELEAKEIISLEGVGSDIETTEPRAFYFTNTESKNRDFQNLKLDQLKEGIIMGVTSALLLKTENMPISCILAETHSNLPDSKAAAKIIEILDGYLGLKVDYKPLLETAKKFEEKIKKVMQQSRIAETERDKKALSYVG